MLRGPSWPEQDSAPRSVGRCLVPLRVPSGPPSVAAARIQPEPLGKHGGIQPTADGRRAEVWANGRGRPGSTVTGGGCAPRLSSKLDGRGGAARLARAVLTRRRAAPLSPRRIRQSRQCGHSMAGPGRPSPTGAGGPGRPRPRPHAARVRVRPSARPGRLGWPHSARAAAEPPGIRAACSPLGWCAMDSDGVQ